MNHLLSDEGLALLWPDGHCPRLRASTVYQLHDLGLAKSVPVQDSGDRFRAPTLIRKKGSTETILETGVEPALNLIRSLAREAKAAGPKELVTDHMPSSASQSLVTMPN